MVEKPFLTVTMTGRPPVRIKKAEWPIIASADDEWYDNQYRFQANRCADFCIKVRQHADGRAIVYGSYEYDTHYENSSGANFRDGLLLSKDDSIPNAIRCVGEALAERIEQWAGGREKDGKCMRELIHSCIATLPVEDL